MAVKKKKNQVLSSINALKEKKATKENDKKVVQPIIQKATPLKKMGRPSNKLSDIKYVTFGGMIPEATRKKIKVAMVTTFDGIHETQDEFLNAAVLLYIAENEKKHT